MQSLCWISTEFRVSVSQPWKYLTVSLANIFQGNLPLFWISWEITLKNLRQQDFHWVKQTYRKGFGGKQLPGSEGWEVLWAPQGMAVPSWPSHFISFFYIMLLNFVMNFLGMNCFSMKSSLWWRLVRALLPGGGSRRPECPNWPGPFLGPLLCIGTCCLGWHCGHGFGGPAPQPCACHKSPAVERSFPQSKHLIWLLIPVKPKGRPHCCCGVDVCMHL